MTDIKKNARWAYLLQSFSHPGRLLKVFNYAVYRLAFIQGPYALHKPLFLQIEPTSRCNLKCPMCMRNKYDTRFGDMSFDAFKQIISQARNLYRIHLQGNGEPFLHPQLIDFIRYARRRQIIVTVISNGTLLHRHRLSDIIDSGLNELQISIDSLSKAEYESLRPGADFNRIVTNIKELTAIKQERRSDLMLSLAVVIQKTNQDTLPEFIPFAKKLGVQKVSFQYLEPKHEKKYSDGFYAQNMPADKRIIGDILEKTRRLAEEAGIIFDFVQQRHQGCRWPWEGLYITWEGEVSPCCLIFDLSFGNVFETDLNRIWNNSRMRVFRKRLLSKSVPHQCRGCSHLGA